MENSEELYARMDREIPIDPKEDPQKLLWKIAETNATGIILGDDKEAVVLVKYIKAGGDVGSLIDVLLKAQHGQNQFANNLLLKKIIETFASEKK